MKRRKASLIPLKNRLVIPRTPSCLIVLFKLLKITTIVNTKIKLDYARFFITLVSNNSWSGHRRLLLRFHTAQNSASSGPNPIVGPVLKKCLLPVENLGSIHLICAMAMGQGPLNASNSCACFNRSSSRLPSAKCLEAETAEQN
jgi:hypothetical protein